MTPSSVSPLETVTTQEKLMPSPAQKKWLQRGLSQAGGKLPLFDESGRRVSRRIVQTCLESGWAEPWFTNKLKPDWVVCRLTDLGREILG